jgi:SAM-dependent methyltransferase
MKKSPYSQTKNESQIKADVSDYYDSDYFNWQKNIGAFGAWANAYKFKGSIKSSDTVVDFGCGGGFLLNKLDCASRIGIDPNVSVAEVVNKFNIKHFITPVDAIQDLGKGIVDVIISNHALEHTLNPLQELKNLKLLLKEGGTIHFFVPCDSINYKYNPNDINFHLFSWSPQNLGNLFTAAGYKVDYVRPYIHKWPPFYSKIALLGWPIFNLVSRIYGRLERTCGQVEVKATNAIP